MTDGHGGYGAKHSLSAFSSQQPRELGMIIIPILLVLQTKAQEKSRHLCQVTQQKSLLGGAILNANRLIDYGEAE